VTNLTDNLLEAWDAKATEAYSSLQLIDSAPGLFKDSHIDELVVEFTTARGHYDYWVANA
jgi:hypothetical protein